VDFLLMTEGCVEIDGSDKHMSIPQRYREVIDEAKYADEVGFDYFGCGEQHFDPPYWTISNPETMLAAIARETKRVKLRSTIFLLPFSHPLRLAEAIGTIDILSEGRLEIGTGKGNNSIAMKGFELSIPDLEELYLESLQIIKGALANERFSYSGKYYNFEDLPVLPQSIQRPHPPIYYAAVSPKSHELAAQHGLGLLTLSSALTAEQVKKRFKLYKDNFVDGPGAVRKISMGVQTYCSETAQRAREEARGSITRFLSRAVFLYENTSKAKGLNLDFSSAKKTLDDYDYMIDNNLVAVGDPKAVIDVFEYYRELGADEIRIRCDGMPHELIKKNMKILADKVFPHFK